MLPTLLLLVSLLADAPAERPAPAIVYRTQESLSETLEQPLNASWKGASLRSALRQLARDRRLAILLDRRIDPDRELDLAIGARKLRELLERMAADSQGGLSRVGNTLVIAPPAAARRLRTLVAFRTQELRTAKPTISEQRRRNLETRRETIGWKDFDRPADALIQIAGTFGLTITGLERVPHDLWTGAILPKATVAEALTLVLNQVDLTFRWTDAGRGVEIVELPATIAIEREYAFPEKTAASILDGLKQFDPQAQTVLRNGKVAVRGAIETHEWLQSRLDPRATPKGRLGSAKAKPSLERQTFTLRAEGVSLRDLLAELVRRDIPLRYDADALADAGVDMNRKVSINVTDLPARAFFKKLLEPAGLKFRFDAGNVVIESPSPMGKSGEPGM